MVAGTLAKMIKQGDEVTLRVKSKGEGIASERMVIVVTGASFKQSPCAWGECKVHKTYETYEACCRCI